MSLVAAVTDLVLPQRCAGCGVSGAALCPACGPSPADRRQLWLPGVGPVLAAAPYDGAVRSALLAWKERGRTGLTRVLASWLARSVRGVLAPAALPPGARALLVPVPASAAARRARGGDVLARLAHAAGVRAGVRRAHGALCLARPVQDSAGLGRAERQENLRGAFAARAGPPGAVALLVDDIVTTGTTLREAASALQAAGWVVVGAAAVAATPRPGESAPTHWQGTGGRSSVGAT